MNFGEINLQWLLTGKQKLSICCSVVYISVWSHLLLIFPISIINMENVAIPANEKDKNERYFFIYTFLGYIYLLFSF